MSWVVPAGSLNFPASVPGIEYHEWKAAVTPVSSISHKGQVAGAKVLAASIIDLMTSPELLQKARAEFEVESKKTPYFSLLPPDAKPDLELNRAEMEKYRGRHAQVLSGQDAALQLMRVWVTSTSHEREVKFDRRPLPEAVYLRARVRASSGEPHAACRNRVVDLACPG